jgi:hypothetical protein
MFWKDEGNQRYFSSPLPPDSDKFLELGHFLMRSPGIYQFSYLNYIMLPKIS